MCEMETDDASGNSGSAKSAEDGKKPKTDTRKGAQERCVSFHKVCGTSFYIPLLSLLLVCSQKRRK